MNNRKELKLNMNLNDRGMVMCAKSHSECNGCKECCELMELSYDQFSNKEIIECFTNDERRR